MTNLSPREKFKQESQVLEALFNEDSEWVYQWVEYMQKGESRKARYIDNQVRPKLLAKISIQMQKTWDAMEELCKVSQKQ